MRLFYIIIILFKSKIIIRIKKEMEIQNKLNIVQLIEKNPITRLTKSYQNKFIEKIRTNFTETQQQLYVSSFYLYLNHSKDDYIID